MIHQTRKNRTMKGNETTPNEEELMLQELLGSDIIVTPAAMAQALGFLIQTMKEVITQELKEQKQEAGALYLPVGKLSHKFGMSEATAWRILRGLVEKGSIKVIRYDATLGQKKSYARYNVADFEQALLVHPIKQGMEA